MKSRTKKRYISISQINDEIDRYKAKARKLRDSADAYDIQADRIAQSDHAELNVELIGFNRIKASKLRRSAFNIENKKMVDLKQKLAEFTTDPLPGIIDDRLIQR